MVFDRLFGRKRKKRQDPGIRYGRYSDNNKSPEQVSSWTEADRLFREEQYTESLDAFFHYLKDPDAGNVVYERTDHTGRFELMQGSKIVRGSFDDSFLQAEVTLARMPESNVPVMRRLLEMNFHLYYSRFAFHDNIVCMRFDSDITTINPNKLYYGLRELATKADKQDDLLVQEFSGLEPTDLEHVISLPEQERQVKYLHMQQWLTATLDYVKTLDPEKFAGGIAYLLIAVVFRIDFLVSPEGKLMNELEKIVDKYYRKEEKPTPERNLQMIEALQRLRNKSPEDVYPYLFKSKHTFSIVSPQHQKSIAETINNALQNMYWYRDNNYPLIANEVMEYSLSFSLFSFSLPKPFTELFQLFMEVNHGKFFEDLGYGYRLYNEAENSFEEDEITERIEDIVSEWRSKYRNFAFDTGRLKFGSRIQFNQSFLTELTTLNFDS